MRKDCVARELTREIIVGAFMVMILLGLGYFTAFAGHAIEPVKVIESATTASHGPPTCSPSSNNRLADLPNSMSAPICATGILRYPPANWSS